MIGRLFRRLIQLPLLAWQDMASMVEAIVRNWPGMSGYAIRRTYYRRRLKHLGRNVRIEPGVRFVGHAYISIDDGSHIDLECLICAGPMTNIVSEIRRLSNPHFTLKDGEVSIGKGVHVAVGCYILGHGGVQIGDYCTCSGGTRILSCTNHYASYADPGRRDIYFSSRGGAEHTCYIVGPVVLLENVGVASNCILLPGVTVSRDSFVGLGSVVHPKNGVFPPNSIVAGNPAARIRSRFA